MLLLVSATFVAPDPRLRDVVLCERLFSPELFDFLVIKMQQLGGNAKVLTCICRGLEALYESQKPAVRVDADVANRWSKRLNGWERSQVDRALTDRLPSLLCAQMTLCLQLRGTFELVETPGGLSVITRKESTGVVRKLVEFGEVFVQALAMLENLERDPLH